MSAMMNAMQEELSLSIGSAAAQLGVAPETLRSWGRRYGLSPSSRTNGGHRRYSSGDMTRLIRMQHLVAGGMTPARAAMTVQSEPDDPQAVRFTLVRTEDAQRPVRRRPGGPGGRILAVPGASRESRGLARAVSRLDADAIGDILRELLRERGTAKTWDVVIPVLVAIGDRWNGTGECVEIEHLLSEVCTDALRAHRAVQLRPTPGRPVLLAASPDEQHVLPVHVLAAALAEQRIPVRVLGAALPMIALNTAIARSGASAVFVWRQMPGESGLRGLVLPRSRPPVRVLVGGPGFEGVPLPPGVRFASSLQEATGILRATVR